MRFDDCHRIFLFNVDRQGCAKFLRTFEPICVNGCAADSDDAPFRLCQLQTEQSNCPWPGDRDEVAGGDFRLLDHAVNTASERLRQ